MKQYTDNKQTAKLIELGVEKPKGWYIDGVTNNIKLYVNIDENPMMFNYSIGELLSFLPIRCLARGFDYRRVLIEDGVFYYDQRTGDCIIGFVDHKNLIDNIFDAIVRLKEEGVI